jgi:hypothetical protein
MDKKEQKQSVYELKSMNSKNIAEMNKYHAKECKGRGYAKKGK